MAKRWLLKSFVIFDLIIDMGNSTFTNLLAQILSYDIGFYDT